MISPVIIVADGGVDPPVKSPFKGFNSPSWLACVTPNDLVGEPGIGGNDGGVVGQGAASSTSAKEDGPLE